MIIPIRSEEDVNPDLALSYFMQGEFLLNQGNYSLAVLEFQDAIDLDPNAATIHVSIADAYRKLGKIKRSKNHLNIAIDLDPNETEALEILGEIHIQNKDYLNAQSTQPALRGMIEEFSANCGFILTCNYKNRLIEPLQSRCSTIDFSVPKVEKKELAEQFFKRVLDILSKEEVKCEPKAVAEVINKFFPDWRKVLNELQRYSASGRIDAGILVDLSDVNIKELMYFMKNKEFTNVRKWVVDNIDNDPTRVFRDIYDSLYTYVDGSSIPHAVVILGEYQYKAAFVADQEINTLACLTEIMSRVKFK